MTGNLGPLLTPRTCAAPIGAATACGCSKSSGNARGKVQLATAGAVLASLGTCAACCLLPAALIGMGIAGSVVTHLDALSSYKWVFIAITVTLLGYGFYTVYWNRKQSCASGPGCTACGPSRSVRFALWLGTVLAVGGIVYGFL